MPTDAEIQSLIGTAPPPNLKRMPRSRWGVKNPPKDPKISFTGKTVLVTGSNTGVGFQAALKFAALGAKKLILAVRTLSKGQEARAKIVAATGCNDASVVVMELDMNSYASIKSFASKLEAEIGSLDVALLNAGIAAPKYIVNKSTGWETSLQVNNISTALVAVLLMPILKKTAAKTGQPSQLTLTGSFGHKEIGCKDFNVPPGESVLGKLNSPEFFELERTYCAIKVITMYIMLGLINDFSTNSQGKTDVFINVTCPGLCSTDLGREFPWYYTLPTKLTHMYYARSAEQGGRSLVSATLLGKLGHGKFWTNDVIEEQGDLITSEQGKRMQAVTWREIKDICNKELPGRNL